VLKIVKNQLRSTISQDKLCDLSILTIEADLTNNIDFECVVSEFAKLTSMKKGNYLVSRYKCCDCCCCHILCCLALVVHKLNNLFFLIK